MAEVEDMEEAEGTATARPGAARVNVLKASIIRYQRAFYQSVVLRRLARQPGPHIQARKKGLS
jgi:hypothetical protein